ncbi:MAG: peptidoglycan DD-metalloendopeptidase family protein, partial [Bacteroidales bacterium]|nr:peptidoglycan DD-metalloendopeptidase family protein [Bacteroidales bacterium]
LSSILNNYKVDNNTIDLINRKSKGIIDLRKIKAGNNYTVLCSNDSSETVSFFIYEESPVNYIVFSLKDSIHVYAGKKAVKYIKKSIKGEIKSSLWNAMKESNTDPELAMKLSEIYGWTIDFFALQKGDNFKVIYEEISINDEIIGIGNILASVFNYNNKPYYAYYFVQDSIGDYFDENGNNLKRAFLKAPLRFSRISSRFSHSRFHPILRIARPHHGVDYSAPKGTPVYTIGNGTVIACGYSGGGGNTIKIRHNANYTTSYMHLSAYAKGIRSGKQVQQGEVVGYVGSTGLSTGPHLDFRVYKNGRPVNPLTIESPPGKPVDKSKLSAFMPVKEDYYNLLIQIK